MSTMKKPETGKVMDHLEIDGEKIAISRRSFLKSSAFFGGVLAASQLPGMDLFSNSIARAATGSFANAYPFDKAENVIYSCCLQCHTACTIKVKILDGTMVKVDGNPYSPVNMHPHLPYDTSPKEAALYDGRLCPKGQAGIQTMYDPYRIRKVLKRKAGSKRGEGKWVTIDFNKAVDEIVNGGDLFGEGHVEGLKDILAIRDPKLMKALEADAQKVAKNEMSAAEFQALHQADLDKLIDPEFPDLGPKNNQFVFLAGRIEHGRKEFSQRWLKGSLGSTNWFEHTSVCEQSHHIATKKFASSYKGGAYHPGLKEVFEEYKNGPEHFKPDVPNCEFIIFFGTSPFEANFGPTNWASFITNAQARNGMKFAVVDPRCSNTAAKANYWLPVKPGGDAALAFGMMRWIIDHKTYNEPYLRAANRSAATKNGDTTWCDATHLVLLSDDGKTGLKFLRSDDAGLNKDHSLLVSVNGVPVAVADPYKEADAPVVGDLFAEGTINGMKYKTVFALLRDLVTERSVDKWAEESGIPVSQLIEVADEFTSHGRKAVADMYRGPVQHTNGYHNGRAILTLNLLVGNGDWKGGLTKGAGQWHEDGSKTGQPFPLSKLHPNKLGAFGVNLSREGLHYEDSSLFFKHGYPAKRAWYPYTGSVYQEVIPSAADGYPYPIKALYLHKGTPGLSVPGANATLEILRDTKKIPLFFADDIVIGESSMYCDYIFPDTAIWERWGVPHVAPNIAVPASKVRQPAVESLVENCTVFNRHQPISMEAVMLAIAEKLQASGFGKDGFGPGLDFQAREDFFLKMVANIAYGDKEGKDMARVASSEELKVFRDARRHLTPASFDELYWQRAVGGDGDLWRRTVTVLNRGGRFAEADGAYDGAYVKHQFKSQFHIFAEDVALGKHCMTGEHLPGMPVVQAVQDAAGKEVTFGSRYPFRLFTYKHVLGGQSRTIGNYWTMVAEAGQNYIWMNTVDARSLGLEDGDLVRLVSPDNPKGTIPIRANWTKDVTGNVKVMEGIRPGTICASWSFGHWAYGASDVDVDGQTVKGDARRGTGICVNPVMAVDPVVKNMCLSDPIGGSCSFYDSFVGVVKA
jgi:tetrathionate reductase subunit A